MKNLFKTQGDITLVYMNAKGVPMECIIDTADLPILNSYTGTWNINSDGYPRICVYKNNTRTEYILHRLLCPSPEGMLADHINRNRLDNRRSNLRVVTKKENLQNRSASKNSASGMSGVQWNESRRRWMVCVTMPNGRTKRFGQHISLIEAKRVCTRVRVQYMPLSVQRTPIKIG